MKPNPAQQQFIKEQLQSMLKVRETYEELYDHILTALEEVPDDVPFDNAVNQIIEHDLGGKRGIRSLQKKELKEAVRELSVLYGKHWLQCLTSYHILLPAGLTVGAYLLMLNNWLGSDTVGIICIFINLIPGTVVAAKTLKLQESRGWATPKTDYALSCIKPFVNILMINFPIFLWLLSPIICHYLQNAGVMAKQIGYYGLPINIATTFVLISVLHTFTYYKLYKQSAVKAMAK